MPIETTKWVLVAGTGRYKLSEAENWASKEIGKAIAGKEYGLVVGGWQGVDYVVAQAFADELRRKGKPLSDYLIQVVPEGKYPEFKGGHIVYVEPGLREWTESVRYADAIILIGGLGGTYETYQFAAQEQKPVFPIYDTGGDAVAAYNDILTHWNLLPIKGIQQEEFENRLRRKIQSEADAGYVVDEAIQLITQYLKQEEQFIEATRNRIFISYSHRDTKWLLKLRTILKPLEWKMGLNIWDDTAIEAGQRWKEEIQAALDTTKVAIFLVSPNFLASDFIKHNELPPLLQKAAEKQVTILWIHVSACLYDVTSLKDYQAAHDISRPLDRLRPSMQNEVLVEISKNVRKAIE